MRITQQVTIKPNQITNQNMKTIKMGDFLFRTYLSKKLMQSDIIENALKKDGFQICYQDYQKYQWKNIVLQMLQCDSDKVKLYNNNHPQIIKQISHIKFTHLKYLMLDGNNINNIQALTWINLEALNTLLLGTNHITRIQAFHKLSASNLKKITLIFNNIEEISSLWEINSQLQYLHFSNQYIYFRFSQYGNQIFQDLNQLIKFKGQKMKQIGIGKQLRIPQDKVLKIIRARYPKISI